MKNEKLSEKIYFGLKLQSDPPHHLDNNDRFMLLFSNTELGAWKLFGSEKEAKDYIKHVDGVHSTAKIVVVRLS